MITDQGKEIVNHVNEEFMALAGWNHWLPQFHVMLHHLMIMFIGTDHCVTSAYHPQSNGLIKRLNQTLKNTLLKLVNNHQDNWGKLLDAGAALRLSPFLLELDLRCVRCVGFEHKQKMDVNTFMLTTLLPPRSSHNSILPNDKAFTNCASCFWNGKKTNSTSNLVISRATGGQFAEVSCSAM